MFKIKNKLGREELIERLENEDFDRRVVSIYKYVKIANPREMRDQLFLEWDKIGVLGRTYLAKEGINAQISVPMPKWDRFVRKLYSHPEFDGVRLNVGVEQRNDAFIKLQIKIKPQIVADGLSEDSYDIENVGKHLNAEEFNKHLEEKDTVCVDMRNFYESEVGHFEGAITPDVTTFKEQLPKVKDMLEDKKDKKILLYCTGGVRCEKTSAYLKHHGFKDVNQLYGGIIHYTHEAKEKGLPLKFKGKNFVFDDRFGETITDDVLSTCHLCDNKSNHHTNCANKMCNVLFIECEECSKKLDNCCSVECQEIIKLPLEKQKILAQKQGPGNKTVFRRRVQPSEKTKQEIGR